MPLDDSQQLRQRSYLCIDLKSFYASVECVERRLDPLETDLVVADPARTEKTICLAVSPSLKRKGVRNRCRVFEIPEGMDYIMAPPRMQLYINYSARIYRILLRWFSKRDIHVYSIDEAFMDATDYLGLYGMDARNLGLKIRSEILAETGIPATCGVGTNLYLAKIALDITAKHSPDFFGELDEASYRSMLWGHTPLTDFWRIGPGTARRLHGLGIDTMGQLALYPSADRIFEEFGKDAEILLDHAWGIEPCTMADIKAYRNKGHSLGNGQVLACNYTFDEAAVIVREMADACALDLVDKNLVASALNLAVRYAKEDGDIPAASATVRFVASTNSAKVMADAAVELFRKTADENRFVRGLNVVVLDVRSERTRQTSLYDAIMYSPEENRRQRTILEIKGKFGKNALLKGVDLLPKATQRERNEQIGGHRSGV